MKHYKTPTGQIYAFESDGAQDTLIAADMIPVTDAEAELIRNQPKTQADLDAEESAKSKAELAALDLASIPMLRAYIASKADAPQELKDLESASVLKKVKVK